MSRPARRCRPHQALALISSCASLGASAFISPLPPLPPYRHNAPSESSPSHVQLELSSTNSQVTSLANEEVVFSKVVRPPPYLQDDGNEDDSSPLAITGKFLGGLVTYLEHGLEVPEGLMVNYDKILPNDDEDHPDNGNDLFDDEFDDDGDGSTAEDEHTVCIFDSPLSSDPSDSRLSVEVVAVYPEDDQAVSPTMAMVVVKKPNGGAISSSASGSSNVMVSGLFDDAKKRIIKALDVGLDDWSEGRVRAADDGNDNSRKGNGQVDTYTASAKKNRKGQVDAEIEEAPYSSSATAVGSEKKDVFEEKSVNWDRAIIDAEVLETEPFPKAKGEKKMKAVAEKKSTTANPSQIASASGSEDFAVQAARRAAAAAKARKQSTAADDKKQKEKTGAGDRKAQPKSRKNDNKKASDQIPLASMVDTVASDVSMTSSGPKFRVSLNRPKRPGQNRRERKLRADAQNASVPKDAAEGKNLSSTTASRAPASSSTGEDDFAVAAARAAAQAKGASTQINEQKKENGAGNAPETDRKINAFVQSEEATNFDEVMLDSRPSSPADASTTGGGITKTDAEIEQDIMKEAVKFMPSADDMSAEQLLKDVLKFGDEMDKEEAPGTGFAEGAFDKARELMREERKPPKSGVGFAEPKRTKSQQKFFQDLEASMDKQENTRDDGKPLTEEEELKRIFAAGEQAAEGRIVSTMDSNADEDPIVTEEYIDDLIASDRTVPRDARLLDDELAQMSVRMSKSVDESESLDGGRGPNPLFDVMSGPEAYNPNVADPTTAVNWPGAMPGTRNDVRLPPELKEAVQNAKFAAKFLAQLDEVVDEDEEGRRYFVDGKEFSKEQVQDVRTVVEDAVAVGLIEDPLVLMAERARLNILVKELKGQEDRFQEIAQEYKDLLLSDNFIPIVKQYLNAMIERDLEARQNGEADDVINERHQEEREIITKLIQYAQVLLKQVRALGAELEASHLEVIRSICNVAMDPSHTTEEETATALTDAVQDMRAMFDDSFVAYLKYAIAEEEAKLARAGVLDDPEYNRWLFVLKIIQEGVYKELAKSVNRLLEHIWYILRFESKSERRMLLEELVDIMPTLDVRPFVSVVDNIVGSLGSAVKGEFDVDVVGDMTNKLLQLHRDVKEVLPPERITEMSRDADEWAENRRKRLMEAREQTQKRLANAAKTDAYDPDQPGRGEIERMT